MHPLGLLANINHRSSENNNDPIVPFVPLQFEKSAYLL